MRLSTWIPWVLLTLASTTSWALEIEQLTVKRDRRTFETHAVFVVDAPRAVVVDIATDFDRLEHINPAVIAMHVQPLDDGKLRLTTTLRDCAPVMCRTLVLVEHVQRWADDRLTARIVPDAGDFSAGRSSWVFDAFGGQTRVHYRSEIRPDFFVPPLVGTAAFKKALRRQIRATAQRLEEVSRAREVRVVQRARG